MCPKTRYLPDEVLSLPVLWAGDVAVVGGGSAGSTAAVAAGRSGARTLLIESGAFLGGTGTRVLDTFYGFYSPGPGARRVVGGIGWEVCEMLTKRGMAFERANTYGAGTGITYEPEALKGVWDELLESAGVDVLLFGLMTGVVMDDDRVVGVVVETKVGAAVVKASVVIDASGEAEVAWRAGATIDNGDGTRHLQPATATFRMGGVHEPAATTKELHALIAQASLEGYDLPRKEGSIHITLIQGIRHANMTRVSGQDLSDPWQLLSSGARRPQAGLGVRQIPA